MIWSLSVRWRVVLLSVMVCAGWCGADERLIEPERAGSLLRFPFDNESWQGWYAREAIVRGVLPGEGWVAAIHDSAPSAHRGVSLHLSRPLPAGTHHAFIRVVGPRDVERPSIVELEGGGGRARIEWDQRTKWGKPQWIGPATITTTAPTDRLMLRAIQFGGSGNGAIYEPVHRSLWIDTIYLTDSENPQPPTPQRERTLRGAPPASADGERPTYAADETGPSDPKTPRPVHDAMVQPIHLIAFDGRANLWPNSSLELGMNDGWAASTRRSRHIFTDADFTTESPYHGQYALRIPPRGSPFSRPYLLTQGGTYTLSLCLRAVGALHPVRVALKRAIAPNEDGFKRRMLKAVDALTITATPDRDWQRIGVTGKLEPGWYYLSLDGEGAFDLDAIQLEVGDEATSYAPRANVEGALRTDQLGNILYEDQSALVMWLHNDTGSATDAALRYRIVDVREQTIVEAATAPHRIGPQSTHRVELPIVPEVYGIFSVQYRLSERDAWEGELVYMRGPRPVDRPTRHELGGNMGFPDDELAVHARLGLDWQLTCKSRLLSAASEGVHPKPDVWHFFDEEAARPKRYGLQSVICFWPQRIPAFMREPTTGRYRTFRGIRRREQPNLELWKQYVSTIVGRYKGKVRWWCIDDEIEINWPAEQFAPIAQATIEAARAANPEAKIGISATPEYVEELLHHIDADAIDVFGGSTFDLPYHQARRVRHLKQRYGKKWITYGVGLRPPAYTMYHSLYTYQPAYAKAARMARRVINLLLVQDVDVAGHYAAILQNLGIHQSLNKPLVDYDGTPIPWGATFGILGNHLADAVPVTDVRLGGTDTLVHIFRLGSTLGAVTYANNKPHYDLHWRPEPRSINAVKFLAPGGSLRVVDMFWNPRRDVRRTRSTIELDLDEEPVFFLADDVELAAFADMFRRAETGAPPLRVRTGFAWTATGEVEVTLGVTNLSSRPMRDVKIDLRPPAGKQPMGSGAAWIFARATASIDRIDPNQTRIVTLPTLLDGRLPLEVGVVRINVTTAEGLELAFDDALWMLPARQLKSAAVVDGRLTEWTGHSAAWLAYDWGWSLLGRHVLQIHDGAEYLSYPPYRLDARASVWAGYDHDGLCLAVRLDDDQPIAGSDEVRVTLTNGDSMSEQWHVRAVPQLDGSCLAELRRGEQAHPLKAAAHLTESRIDLEIAIPWRLLGIEPDARRALGFDLYWTDVDREDDQLVSGTLRWAGLAQHVGTMLLSEPAP